MSEISNNKHYACYFPYTGRLTGQTVRLKYWIQVPDETKVGPRPAAGWPLVIQCPGTGYYHPDTGTSVIYSDPEDENSDYYLYPAIRILPKVDEFHEEWICLSENHIAAITTDMRYEVFHAVRSLIDSFLSQSTVFYKELTGDDSWNIPSDFALPAINFDKIYYLGHSLGASYLMRVLQVFHDYLAGIFSGGYVAFNQYDTLYLATYQKRLIESSLHIGTIFYGGEFDYLLFNSLTTGKIFDLISIYNEIVGEREINPWYFCKITNGYHGSPAPSAWQENRNYIFGNVAIVNEQNYICIKGHTSTTENAPPNSEYWRGPVSSFPLSSTPFRANSKFDPSNHGLQTFGSTGTKIKDWLFAQTRQTPLAVDYSMDEVIVSGEAYYPLGIYDKVEMENIKMAEQQMVLKEKEMECVPGIGVMFAYGKTVPGSGKRGYAKGCLFQHIDGISASDLLYVNTGSYDSCNFTAIAIS